ncbi:hypothetical protein BY996DRAFT_4579756 [Phakopsora pachyrhizi]|nr:hypothetical protein BY996DRAFT_4579756 [Phakopsora pachyrhizi]
MDRSELRGLVDVHCHPNDAFDGLDVERMRCEISGLEVGTVCVMSSSLVSQSVTSQLSVLDKVIPAYGLHPWFSHSVSVSTSQTDKLVHYKELFGGIMMDQSDVAWIESHLDGLPDPIGLDSFLRGLRHHLENGKDSCCMVGEVGLDKSFTLQLKRLDCDRIERSNLKVPVEHQLVLLESQIDLAIELSKNVSLHGVHCQQEILQLFRRLRIRYGSRLTGSYGSELRICWHSAFISVETLRQSLRILPDTVYFSYGIVIYESRSCLKRLEELIRNTPDDRLLIESDWAEDPRLIDSKLIQIIEKISESKGWTSDRTVEQLQKNWHSFFPWDRRAMNQISNKTEGGGGGRPRDIGKDK